MSERSYFYGYAPQCADCLYRLDDAMREGHPFPCRMVRWNGPLCSGWQPTCRRG